MKKSLRTKQFIKCAVYLPLALICSLVQAMDPAQKTPPASPAKTGTTPKVKFTSPAQDKIFFPNTENDGGMDIVLQSLEKTTPKDEIILESFILTDDRITKLLIKKQKQGVKLSIAICGSARHISNQMEKLEKAGVTFTIYNEDRNILNDVTNFPQRLHTKCFAWTYTDPKTGKKEYRVFDGSRNFTFMTRSLEDKNTNNEIMVYNVDQETFESIKNAHQRRLENSKAPGKRRTSTPLGPVAPTPKRKKITHSDQENICADIAQRIANTDKALYMCIFGINDPGIIKACKQVAQKGFFKILVTDRYSLQKDEIKEFLEELVKLGTKVGIFNADGKDRCGRWSTINHPKSFLREQANNSLLVGIGSVNFTASNNHDENNWMYFPNNHQMTQEYLTHINKILTQSTTLKEAFKILKSKAEQKKSKTKTLALTQK